MAKPVILNMSPAAGEFIVDTEPFFALEVYDPDRENGSGDSVTRAIFRMWHKEDEGVYTLIGGETKTIAPVGGTGIQSVFHQWGDSPADAALWVPSSESSLEADWNPAMITGVSDGGAVSTWPDSSQYNRHGTQATGANQPTLHENVINGRPVVRFSGTKFLDTALSASAVNQTIFAVIIPTSNGANRTILGSQAAGGRQFRLRSTQDLQFNKAHTADIADSTGTLTNGTAAIVMGQLGSVTWKFRINGSADSNGAHAQTLMASLASRIGAKDSAAYEPFSGDIARLMVFSGALNDAEIHRIEGLLAYLYGLRGSLPMDHPYKSVAPTLVEVGGWYGWDAEVRDIAGGIDGTSTAGFDLENLRPDGTTDFYIAPYGTVQTVTPFGKEYSLTPQGFSGFYRNATGVNAAQVLIRLLRKNEAGEYTVLQEMPEGKVLAGGVAPNGTISVSWAETGFAPLDWNGEYATEWLIRDDNDLIGEWGGREYFTTNQSPLRPNSIFPDAIFVTGEPLITFQVADPDDDPGAWFADISPVSFDVNMVGIAPVMVSPRAVSVRSDGQIVVAEDGAGGKIRRFDAAGVQQNVFAPAAVGGNSFVSFAGMAVSASGDVYTLEKWTNVSRMRRYSQTGTILNDVTGFLVLKGNGSVARNSTHWATSYGTPTPTVDFTPLGGVSVSSSFQGKGDEPGQFNDIPSIALTDDFLYALDPIARRVNKFTFPDGEYVTRWGKMGWGEGGMIDPVAIAVHPVTNEVYVADTGREEILIYSPVGRYIRSISNPGQSPGDIVNPYGMAFSPSGSKLYVSMSHSAFSVEWLSQYAIKNSSDYESVSALAGEAEIWGPYNFNGDFEVDASGWTWVPGSGWTASFARDASFKFSGLAAGKLNVTAAPNTSAESLIGGPKLPVVPGERYQLAGKIYVDDADIDVNVGMWLSEDNAQTQVLSIDGYRAYIEKIGEWMEFAIPFTCPPGCYWSRIILRISRSSLVAYTGPSGLWLDDFTFAPSVKYIRGADYLSGDSFAYQMVNDDVDAVGMVRVRTRGKDANSHGPWSAPSMFQVVDGPEATLLTPTPGEVFNTATPTYLWTIDSGSQWRFKADVLDALTGVTIYSSDWIQSETTRSYTIPPEAGLVDGGSYFAQLWIDDGKIEVLV